MTSITEGKTLTESGLFLDGTLIDLHISYWRGRRPLSAGDLSVNPDDVPDIFSLGNKLVVPKETMFTFDNIYSASFGIISKYTFPFPTRARFVPYSVLEMVLHELKVRKTMFEERVDSFVENYDTYRQQMIDKYPEHSEALSREYITTTELRKKFKYEYSLYEISLPKSLRFKAVQERDAVEDARARERALAQAEEEYRKQFQEQIDEFLGGSVGKLREAVGGAVANLAERLQEGDAITKGSLDSLKRTIEKFRTLNFVGDKSVEEKLTELEAMIPESGKKFEEGEFKKGFQMALSSVTETLMESDISVVTGEYKRKLRL